MPKLAARWVVPIDAPPIEDGVIEIEGQHIVAVGPRHGADAIDYGNAILMPGLVNAHTHIEYTVLRGFLEDVPFFPWIRTLTAMKARLSEADWKASATLGAMECIASGITTVGDNADARAAAASAVSDTGLRAVIYQETFGIDESQTINDTVAGLESRVGENIAAGGARVHVGISPHALYTIRPALFSALNAWAVEHNMPMSIHVAESVAESDLTLRGQGPFAEMFQKRGIDWPVPLVSPTRYIADMGVLRTGTLAVHCVQQSSEDIEILSSSGASVVYCPKSNAKLGAGIAPLTSWLAPGGLNIAIGTDSAVSNNTHDLFEEMRFGLLVQRAINKDAVAVTAETMLNIATLGGARALGLDAQVGSLTPGKRADIIAIDLGGAHAVPATDPYHALLYTTRASDVIATYVDGELLYDRGRWSRTDTAAVIESATEIRARLSQAD